MSTTIYAVLVDRNQPHTIEDDAYTAIGATWALDGGSDCRCILTVQDGGEDAAIDLMERDPQVVQYEMHPGISGGGNPRKRVASEGQR